MGVEVEPAPAEAARCDPQALRPGPRLQPSQHAANAGQQLARLERLGQIVVGTCTEAGQAALDRAGGGQHDDADRAAGAAQALDDGEAVLARHVDVEDQDVGRLLAQQ